MSDRLQFSRHRPWVVVNHDTTDYWHPVTIWATPYATKEEAIEAVRAMLRDSGEYDEDLEDTGTGYAYCYNDGDQGWTVQEGPCPPLPPRTPAKWTDIEEVTA